MNETAISWTKLTWNVFSGCQKVSPGCKHCYAETLSENKRGTKAFPNGFELTYRWHKLDEPLKIKEPSMIFVNSMSDLYLGEESRVLHDREIVPVDDILRVFDVMTRARWHTYQILTKRSKRLLEIDDRLPWGPHIWQGVSIEGPDYLWRLDDLRRCHAHVKFVSFEPLLGEIVDPDLTGIAWAIVGGESGPGYRPMQMTWARALRDACVRQGTAFFYKQSAAPRTEMHPHITEEDGSVWEWHQFPGALTPPKRVECQACTRLHTAA